MRSFWQDVKFGIRLLVAQGRFSVVAIVILALGVGTPTVVFSVVNATLLRPLPYQDPDQLVAITGVFRSPGAPDAPGRTVALTDVEAWRKSSRNLASMGAFAYTQIAIRVGDQALSPVTALLDPHFLPTLDVPLALGSNFPDDPSRERTAIISHRLWSPRKRRCGPHARWSPWIAPPCLTRVISTGLADSQASFSSAWTPRTARSNGRRGSTVGISSWRVRRWSFSPALRGWCDWSLRTQTRTANFRNCRSSPREHAR